MDEKIFFDNEMCKYGWKYQKMQGENILNNCIKT